MRYRAFPESRDTEHFRFYYNKSTIAKVTLQIFYNNSFSPKQRRAFFYNKFVFAPRKRTLKTKELHEEKI